MGDVVPPAGSAGEEQGPEQREQLARGIIRLDAAVDHLGAEAGSRETNGAASSAAHAPMRPSTTGSPLSSPGAILASYVAQVAARTMVWGDDWLRGASQAYHESGRVLGQDATFFTDLHVMNVISHALEERAIETNLRCEVYAGFQRLSLMRPQVLRYRELVRVAEWVSVFGLRDDGADAVIREVASPRLLPFAVAPQFGTGLEQFWFVVISSPQFATALLARHVEGDLWARQQNTRRYQGFWTFDPSLVQQIVVVLREGARKLHYSA